MTTPFCVGRGHPADLSSRSELSIKKNKDINAYLLRVGCLGLPLIFGLEALSRCVGGTSLRTELMDDADESAESVELLE